MSTKNSDIESSILIIAKSHFPEGAGSFEKISYFENSNRVILNPEMRAFYLAYNGVRLFSQNDPPYHFLPIEGVIRAREAIFGCSDGMYGPELLYVICDIRDGNFVAADFSTASKKKISIIDCFHETFPSEKNVICDSFGEFLCNALRSKGEKFWL